MSGGKRRKLTPGTTVSTFTKYLEIYCKVSLTLTSVRVCDLYKYLEIYCKVSLTLKVSISTFVPLGVCVKPKLQNEGVYRYEVPYSGTSAL